MNIEDFAKGMKILGIAYGVEYKKDDCEVWFEFLNKYSCETFRTAIKNIVSKSRFVPKINELIEECENCKEQSKFEILDFMKEKGYFKDIKEYDKATMFLEKGIIPDFLKEDMKEYYKIMKQNKLENKEKLMLN